MLAQSYILFLAMKYSKIIRTVTAAIVIAITFFVVRSYLNAHPALIHQLGSVSLPVLISVFLLYLVMFGIILQLFHVTILLCHKSIKRRENFYINGYSIGLNFILPGQTGPIFRSGYVKRKYGIAFKTFLSITLLYYFFYTLICLSFISVGSRPWWQSIVFILSATAVLIYGTRWYVKKKALDVEKIILQKKWATILLLLTSAQFSLQTIIYYIELKAVDHLVAFHQVIAYTGIANISLFVGLTPAGIGIRESFLVLSEKIHQIPVTAIVLANLIDRSIYIIFIVTIVVTSVILHKFFKNWEKA